MPKYGMLMSEVCEFRMSDVYEYRLPGRRPGVLLGLSVAFALFAVGYAGKAPLLVWMIWAGSGATLAGALLANPIHGTRIDSTSWTWFTRRSETPVELCDIDQVTLTSWSDGPDDCRILMKDGSVVEIPSICLPPAKTLATLLAERGIPVLRH